ncbi:MULTISPECIES: anthranilate phosphoribosyltransferase [unclassified Nitratiruptor]|uniref:anthranilate phosphoribosyltransferase n=1 Tax=unclassified Nitratiruptor TaxID=2624044 RepID=UPI001916866C|nr:MULTISPECIES: anthranilate phosphoribosyltransferase [unclassified Nitratiruptor]BCD60431.1 anthranilate phosphoribosyltransferase [Nitratiruptor sp. YY08-10]BCD64080.1 anthranilate phosphoribosyltransferase [Nitratiruptor sp. YY08-14]
MFEKLFNNELSEQEARAFLIELYKKGERAEDIAEAAKIMREHSIKLPISKNLQEKLIDVVGTGGDKSGSFNVSSTVALLLPSLGSYVAKHGNRSITSKSGSADMLEALGIELDLTPEKQVEILQKCGFCFIFAKNHHPVMKHIMPIRKSIPHRTIFNILGPLTNPAGAKKYLLGVFDKEFVPKLAEALKELGAKKALVVSSEEGMDEISISGKTYVAELNNGHITYYEIAPEDYGLQRASFESILGGDAIENAEITRAILSGEESGPKRDMVLLNAGAALYVDGKASSIREGVEMAMEAIKSGKAQEKLNQIIQVSKELLHEV